jgi:dienelactone hydrolase
MALQTRLVEYAHEGEILEGFFAWNDEREAPLPGVLIAHAWGGRDAFVCDKARVLAGLGYAAFALDMYGKGVLGSGPEENAKLMQRFTSDRATLQTRMHAALAALRQQTEADAGRIAAIGFCFGGLCVLDLARTGADLRGAVSFHGLLAPPGNTSGQSIQAKLLILHGYRDPLAPPPQLTALAEELTAAGADWQIHCYGNALHAFTNPKANDPAFGTVYDPSAERRSWQSMRNFLEEVLK